MLSHSSICMALYKYMKHVSPLFCSWDAQVKIKSPMIIVRTTALPSNWAKTDWIAGNTENNTEYTNWQQVPCCHTCVFFCVFLMMCFLSISAILHEQQINCISFSIVWHSCLFWIILISSSRLSTPRMFIVCFIQQVNDCLHMLKGWGLGRNGGRTRCYWALAIYRFGRFKALFTEFWYRLQRSQTFALDCCSVIQDILNQGILLSSGQKSCS